MFYIWVLPVYNVSDPVHNIKSKTQRLILLSRGWTFSSALRYRLCSLTLIPLLTLKVSSIKLSKFCVKKVRLNGKLYKSVMTLVYPSHFSKMLTQYDIRLDKALFGQRKTLSTDLQQNSLWSPHHQHTVTLHYTAKQRCSSGWDNCYACIVMHVYIS